MRFMAVMVTTAFMLAGLFAVGVAETEDSKATPSAPTGGIVVEEDTLIILVDEAEEHFERAHEDFVKKDVKAAASEIRKGAAFLRLQAGRATGEGKEALMASVRELARVANGVKDGTVRSAKELEDAFSRANYALALHHRLKASEAWSREKTKQVGYDLKAAAVHLRNGLAWAGSKSEPGRSAVIDRARDLAEKLIEGAGHLPGKVGPVLESLGKEITALGRSISESGGD